MAQLSSPEQALRLARAIATDIALYSEEEVHSSRQAGARSIALQTQIEEGRILFEGRVLPEFFPLYDEALLKILKV